jgi:hypothetical protein
VPTSQIRTALAFASKAQARAFKKYLKSGSGREFADGALENSFDGRGALPRKG